MGRQLAQINGQYFLVSSIIKHIFIIFYVKLYTHTHIHIYIYIYYIYIHIYTYIYIYIYIYTYIHVLALQKRTGQLSITANLWPLTTHTYHAIIIVTGSFSEKSFFSLKADFKV